jgi:hypothetical protein
MFFDRGDQEFFEAMDMVGYYSGPFAGRAGRRWVKDVCATAWRLFLPRASAVAAR